ncbi:hypothetical protein OESDEN_10172 [Oesophagostomum dentatum]|uniref:Uncharacterized protein n=1 Tax=Oesophagostomum dentatum TaxID=61180 RepID=A0A0B1SXF0_OESDE|nr:hypothetical protein OESDEN_10172 [Oesophagostomum dentatum]
MRKVSSALKSIQSISYDNQALVELSPAISRMSAAIAKTRNCRLHAIPSINLNNLNANMLWWANGGRNPTQQRVQNLFNTASLCIERYC